jgi:O-antigen ligase
MAAALFAVPLVVDPGAEAAFDAPKRFLALVAITGASLALLWSRGPDTQRGRLHTVVPWWAAGLAAGALLWAVVAALLSPRSAAALDGARTLVLFALLLPLGARIGFQGHHGRLLLAAFLAASAVNAILAVLQGAGALRLFAVETLSGRQDTGALLGNEGHLALLLALAFVTASTLAFEVTRPALRGALLALLVVFLAALALNRNLTAFVALAAGLASFLALRYHRRALVPIGLGLVAVAAATLLAAPLRQRAVAAWSDARAGSWDRLLTYRLGPWAAAAEMIRSRPLLGWGPGSFGAEFVPHRLRGELRYRTRFLNPGLTSSYPQAHCEYLQAAAEAGIPPAVAAVVAVGLVIAGATRVARRDDGPRGREAEALVAFLVTGTVAALTWFPLQQPASAIPLLLATGRAWALWSEEADA